MAITLNAKDFVIFEGTYTAKDGSIKPYAFVKLDRYASNSKALIEEAKKDGVKVFKKN